MKIYSRFYGNVVLAVIDSDDAEVLGDYKKSSTAGLYVPLESSQKEDGYRVATVIQSSEELLDKYLPGDRIQIPSVGRERMYTIDGKKVWRIPHQDIMGVLLKKEDE